MAYTVLSSGGTGTGVAGGTKTVAVPWTVYTATSDPSVMTVRADRHRVYNAPAFDYARIYEYSRSGYINNIYSYYGVPARTEPKPAPPVKRLELLHRAGYFVGGTGNSVAECNCFRFTDRNCER